MKKVLCIVAISTLILSGCGGSSGDSKTGAQDGAKSNLVNEVANGKCDKKSTVTSYSSSFTDISKINYIYPMGAMQSSHITPVDHMYIYFPENSQQSAPAGTYMITSPAEGMIANIEDFQKTNQYPYPDYRVVIAHSCNLFTVFIHIGKLMEGIKVGAQVTAGQVIADDSQSPGFDYSTFDANTKLSFANPASYKEKEGWKTYTSNPFNYFPADIRSALEAKSLRTSAPFDGKIDYDQVGTAQGNWFEKDSNGYRGKGDQTASYNNHGKIAHGYWDTHLSIAPEAVDNSTFIYSIGDWEGCPCQFVSKGNVDPKSITASTTPTVIELYEYFTIKPNGQGMDQMHPVKGYKVKAGNKSVGLLALQILEDGTMKVEKLPGQNSFSGFSDKAKIYVR